MSNNYSIFHVILTGLMAGVLTGFLGGNMVTAAAMGMIIRGIFILIFKV